MPFDRQRKLSQQQQQQQKFHAPPPTLDAQKVLGAGVNAFKYALDMWKLQAGFKDLKIMAVSAIGTPGCLKGPALESYIKQAPSTNQLKPDEKKVIAAAARGISANFKAWQDQVTVPGLQWYPTFAAFPGPVAPPVPNIPTPLVACASAKLSEMMVPTKLKSKMVSSLDATLKKTYPGQAEAILEALASQIALGFQLWITSQQVMMVMGQGPVPAFAPPYVPVGTVVGGKTLPGKHFLK